MYHRCAALSGVFLRKCTAINNIESIQQHFSNSAAVKLSKGACGDHNKCSPKLCAVFRSCPNSLREIGQRTALSDAICIIRWV